MRRPPSRPKYYGAGRCAWREVPGRCGGELRVCDDAGQVWGAGGWGGTTRCARCRQLREKGHVCRGVEVSGGEGDHIAVYPLLASHPDLRPSHT